MAPGAGNACDCSYRTGRDWSCGIIYGERWWDFLLDAECRVIGFCGCIVLRSSLFGVSVLRKIRDVGMDRQRRRRAQLRQEDREALAGHMCALWKGRRYWFLEKSLIIISATSAEVLYCWWEIGSLLGKGFLSSSFYGLGFGLNNKKNMPPEKPRHSIFKRGSAF